MLVSPTHDQGSIDLVEIYATNRFHIEIDNNSTKISSPLALRKMFLSKKEGMLGSYSNPLLIVKYDHVQHS
jgi:hypothetical protein